MEAKFYVHEIVEKGAKGIALKGQVRSGTLRVGMRLNIKSKIMRIKYLLLFDAEVQQANPGDSCLVAFENPDYKNLVSCVKQIVTFSDAENPPLNSFVTIAPKSKLDVKYLFKRLLEKKQNERAVRILP